MNVADGYYAGPTAEAAETAEYTNAMAFVSNYWPANNGYNYGSTNFANQVAHSVLETTSGKKTYDVTDKVLEGFKVK